MLQEGECLHLQLLGEECQRGQLRAVVVLVVGQARLVGLSQEVLGQAWEECQARPVEAQGDHQLQPHLQDQITVLIISTINSMLSKYFIWHIYVLQSTG